VCQNGGTCYNKEGSFLCVCVNGWEGPHCEINKDDCAVQPCMNGATCHDRVAGEH
jgi:Notch-like protein